MKLHVGFISNSSSSSFVVRGIKVSRDELIKVLGLDIDKKKLEEEYDGNLFYAIIEEAYLKEKKLGIDIETMVTGPVEEELEDDDPLKKFFIVGKSLGEMDDGVVYDLGETKIDDKEVIQLLEKAGFKVEKLSTFVRYLSNDNY